MTTPYTGNNAGPIVVSFTLPSDGDDVDATSVNVAFQPNADNWQYALRVYPNMLTGFDARSTWRALVQFGNTWYLDRSWSTGTEAVVQIYGPTGGGNALDVFAGGGDGNALRGSGDGAGAGVEGVSGATSTSGGVKGFGKSGSNADGLQGTPDGTGAALRVFGQIALANAAYEAHITYRKTSTVSVSPAVHASAYDTVWMYNSGASYDVTLTDPNIGGPGGGPLPEGVRCTFVVPGTQISASNSGTYQTKNTGTVVLKDHAGGVIATFPVPAVGTPKSVTIETITYLGTSLWDTVTWTLFLA